MTCRKREAAAPLGFVDREADAPPLNPTVVGLPSDIRFTANAVEDETKGWI